MPLIRELVTVIAILVFGGACRTQIVSAREACEGVALTQESEQVRDAALSAVLPKLLVPNGRRVLFLRTSNVSTEIHGLIAESLVDAVGAQGAEALLAANTTNSCWTSGVGETEDIPLPIGDDAFWPTLKRADPELSGIIVASAPLFKRDRLPQQAYVIVDYHCGGQCGSMWLIAVRKDTGGWEAAQLTQLLQY